MGIFSSKNKIQKTSEEKPREIKKVQSSVPVSFTTTSKSHHASGILLSPHITEKSTRLAEIHTYAFKVSLSAQKSHIRKAVEGLYGVHVSDITVLNVRGKHVKVGKHEGKSADWRKAMVTIKKGETITF